MHDQRKNKFTISIITPSFNQGGFIEETIRSVISQEGDFYLDYIIMDGGSADNSVEIIKKYEALLEDKKWPVKCAGINYRWVSKKDEGQAYAISKGFNMADGSVFAWLNSDDTYLPDAMNAVAEYFRAYPQTGMVYGKTYFTDKTGVVIGTYPTEPFNAKKLAMVTFMTQSSTFFTKKTYYEAGGLYTHLHYTMDFDFWVRVSKKFKIEYLDAFLSTYRLHAESKTMSDSHAFKFQDEYLRTVMKYYSWAPANRVYGYCYSRLKCTAPAFLVRLQPLFICLTLVMTAVTYIFLNKGIRTEDIRMLKRINFRKLSGEWIELTKK